MSDTQNKQQSEFFGEPVAIMRNLHAMFPPMALLAGIQLNVFTTLKEGSQSIMEIAKALDVQEEKLSPLLHTLVVAGLLQTEGGMFSNTPEAYKFLVNDRPEYLGGLVVFYKMLWGMIQNTADSIKTGVPQAKFDFQALPEEELEAYFRKQIHSSQAGGADIADSIDFSDFRKLLDAGGGSGGAAMAICRKNPHLHATVADFPKVAQLAASFIVDAGMADRIDAAAVDLCSAQPQGEYDAVLLRAVIQTFSKDDAIKILENVGRSMTAGGKIFIVGSILDNSRLGPMSSLAYSLVFLNTYDNGGAYTEDEYRGMLTQTGFGEISVSLEALSDGMGIVSATKV